VAEEAGLTYDAILLMALALPETVEAPHFRSLAVKRAGRFMLAPGREEGTVWIKVPWRIHDEIWDSYPEICVKAPHYEGWPGLLLRVTELAPEMAQRLVFASWEDAPMPSKRRPI
jgi:hypothetical protein